MAYAALLRALAPGIGRNVGDGIRIAPQIFAFGQAPVYDSHQPVGGLDEMIEHCGHAGLVPARDEMLRLAEHRPDIAHLEHQPLNHRRARRRIGGQQLARLVGQIHQDGARFEQ